MSRTHQDTGDTPSGLDADVRIFGAVGDAFAAMEAVGLAYAETFLFEGDMPPARRWEHALARSTLSSPDASAALRAVAHAGGWMSSDGVQPLRRVGVGRLPTGAESLLVGALLRRDEATGLVRVSMVATEGGTRVLPKLPVLAAFCEADPGVDAEFRSPMQPARNAVPERAVATCAMIALQDSLFLMYGASKTVSDFLRGAHDVRSAYLAAFRSAVGAAPQHGQWRRDLMEMVGKISVMKANDRTTVPGLETHFFAYGRQGACGALVSCPSGCADATPEVRTALRLVAAHRVMQLPPGYLFSCAYKQDALTILAASPETGRIDNPSGPAIVRIDDDGRTILSFIYEGERDYKIRTTLDHLVWGAPPQAP